MEIDTGNPGVRFFTLKEFFNKPLDDPEVIVARLSLMKSGPVPAILAGQEQQGYWVKPGPGITRNIAVPYGGSFPWRSLERMEGTHVYRLAATMYSTTHDRNMAVSV